MCRLYWDTCVLIYRLQAIEPWRSRIAGALALKREPGLVVTELSRLECRVKPLREGDASALARFDRFFASPALTIVPSDDRSLTWRPSFARSIASRRRMPCTWRPRSQPAVHNSGPMIGVLSERQRGICRLFRSKSCLEEGSLSVSKRLRALATPCFRGPNPSCLTASSCAPSAARISRY